MLSERNKTRIQEQIDFLILGQFNKDNIELLLIRIREQITKKHKILKEICHFVAHSNRTQGYTFDHTIQKVSDMLDKFNKGGKWIVHPIFDKHDLYYELIEFLIEKGIYVDGVKLLSRKDLFFESLYLFLDDIEIDIKHDDIEKITFCHQFDSLNMQHMLFEIKLNKDIKGKIDLYENIPIALPLF